MTEDRKRTHDQSHTEHESKRNCIDKVNDETPPWDEEIHRAFVDAVFENGIRHASPAVILDSMSKRTKALTSERVKSHLQKFRKNKDKSKEEFMAEYDSWLNKALTVGAAGGTSSNLTSPLTVLQMMGIETPLGGSIAAFLTYSSLADERSLDVSLEHPDSRGPAKLSADLLREGSKEYLKYVNGVEIPFPVLTEEEQRHPLGISIKQVLALFYSLTRHLVQERLARADQETDEDIESAEERDWKHDEYECEPMKSSFINQDTLGERRDCASHQVELVSVPQKQYNDFESHGMQIYAPSSNFPTIPHASWELARNATFMTNPIREVHQNDSASYYTPYGVQVDPHNREIMMQKDYAAYQYYQNSTSGYLRWDRDGNGQYYR